MNSRRYPNASAFRQAVTPRLADSAAALGLPSSVLLQRFVMERMLCRLFSAADSPFVLKGGFALDLRYRPRARTTRDIDLVPRRSLGDVEDLRRLMEDLVSKDVGDFFVFRIMPSKSFSRTGGTADTARFAIEADLAGRKFARFKVDVGLDPLVLAQPDVVIGEDIYHVPSVRPLAANTLPLAQHFAEKLHALTRRWKDRENTRVKDLVDLVMLIDRDELVVNDVVRCVRQTFAHRATHPLPDELPKVPELWKREFGPLAAQASLGVSDVHAAAGRLRSWLREHEMMQRVRRTHSRHFDFDEAFEILTGHPPFPWQAALFERFISDDETRPIPEAAEIPTGLGKTSIIAIWLLAWLKRPDRLPRRLVYVVNRRTVVDQTTREVERLRVNLPRLAFPDLADRLGANGLAVSTLRGQFADNRAWSSEPDRPAVVCGTVDMIGSRLLFSGYRAGFKTRPMQAAMLGCDTLLVHDESHLEPAFEAALDAIIEAQAAETTDRDYRGTVPGLRVLSLSATRRSEGRIIESSTIHRLSDADRSHRVVKSRLEAAKRLFVHDVEGAESDSVLAGALAEQAIELGRHGAAVLVFVQRVSTVDVVVSELGKALTKQLGREDAAGRISLLIGPMRGYERERLTADDPVFARFQPDRVSNSIRDDAVPPVRSGPVFLVATAAGEVGVNLSADHMVGDLRPLDGMIQRFGRVNRFGDQQDVQIHVVAPLPPNNKGKKTDADAFGDDPIDKSRRATRRWLDGLDGDASPAALAERLSKDPFTPDAFSPPPKRLRFSDILFDAWAMTSLVPPLTRAVLPGCPPVEPYLHGVAPWQPPQTRVAWRDEVECFDQIAPAAEPAELLDDFPVKPLEILTDRTDRVIDAIKQRVGRGRDGGAIPVWIVPSRGKVDVTTLNQLASDADQKLGRDRLMAQLTDALILLPPSAGMLTAEGRLSGDPRDPPSTASDSRRDYDVADRWGMTEGGPPSEAGGRRRRVFRRATADQDETAAPRPPSGMRLVRVLEIKRSRDSNDDDVVDSWWWYADRDWADDVGSRSSRSPQPLDGHLELTERYAARYVETLGLPPNEAEAVRLAARWHDLGKRRCRWQLSIGNLAYQPDHPATALAKSAGPNRSSAASMVNILDGYRHELGSLVDVSVEENPRSKLDPEVADLVMHLIAAHHGRGRPYFPIRESFDTDPDRSEAAMAIAAEVPDRYARLQRRYGRWGLAYLESLVRAADYAASSDDSRDIGEVVES